MAGRSSSTPVTSTAKWNRLLRIEQAVRLDAACVVVNLLAVVAHLQDLDRLRPAGREAHASPEPKGRFGDGPDLRGEVVPIPGSAPLHRVD